ncbi:MAG: elongation factor P 5-aminopentanone reductase [Acutalibacteraceae bacterium]
MSETVLITGASRGIGAAIAALFAAEGFHTIINCTKSVECAENLAEKLREQGGDAVVLTADVSNSAEVNAMFSKAETMFGGVDILVNNAGIAQTKLFTDITDEDWNRMLSINLTGAFYCCRRALPYMLRRHSGRIVNISSMWGQVGGSCEVHYSAAKAGLIGLTKALAQEVGLSGITVNCIAPGVIQTDMLSSYSAEDLKALAEETPTGTLGTPEDVARAVFFLAQKNSCFITGQVLGVNGGFVI